jgi:hypothetical protein
MLVSLALYTQKEKGIWYTNNFLFISFCSWKRKPIKLTSKSKSNTQLKLK